MMDWEGRDGCGRNLEVPAWEARVDGLGRRKRRVENDRMVQTLGLRKEAGSYGCRKFVGIWR